MAFQNPFEQEFFRSNINLKSPTFKENISPEELQRRIDETTKCYTDIDYFARKYFYIVSLDKGKCLIEPYEKQSELLKSFTKYKRNIVLASRQVGKSTSYSIYILWYIITNTDKHVLICANKAKTALEILQRIKMAYEELPMWLKPGVITWNKTKIELSNGCAVSAEATSDSSGRGTSINCISGNETIDILENGIVYTLTLQEAFKKYPIDIKIINNKTYITKLFNENPQILTDTGWSDFTGIVKYNNKNTINANINGKHIICTPDHKIFDGKIFKEAKEFPHKIHNNEDVYDIINVKKNNRFLVNKTILCHNCLVLDEFAFISPGIEADFIASVFPVISSSKNSEIIIVSTPNGMNNEFYRIWNKASLNSNDPNAWHPTKIHWTDVPGRDEQWKEIQLAQLNHDMIKWNQEYECKFLGSVVTLIQAKKIEEFKEIYQKGETIKKPYEISIHPDFPDLKINMYMPPQVNHAYIIGADPSTGDGGDYHAMTIWDITNTFKIELAADFHSNNIPPKQFAYILAKTGFLYNCAYIAIENNGVSYAVIENLTGDFEYSNLINIGGNPKTSIAIHSSSQLKLDACLTAKEIIEDPLRKILIYNGEIISQMERFEKRTRNGKEPIYGCFSSHDDLIMSTIWALYCLKFEILENYYEILKYATNKLGNTIPLITASTENSNDPIIKQIITNIDKTFAYHQTKLPQNNVENLSKNIEAEQQYLMENFIHNNQSNTNYDNYDNYEDYNDNNSNDSFSWDGFIS